MPTALPKLHLSDMFFEFFCVSLDSFLISLPLIDISALLVLSDDIPHPCPISDASNQKDFGMV